MRVLHVVGARPQFVKLGPVLRAIAAAHPDWVQPVLHTGQHYDPAMSGQFFDEFGLPAPDHNLEVGSGPHGEQTARMLSGVENVLLASRPGLVIVYGDTNSTLAGALAASKLGVPIAHVEAGLRSFNRTMPEEINRVVTDHLSDLLLAPTPVALAHLEREGLAARAVLVGDVMADAVWQARSRASVDAAGLDRLGLAGRRYAVATLHRAEGTTAQRLPGLLQALAGCAARFEAMVLPLHPRTREAIGRFAPDWQAPANLRLLAPLGHADMLALVAGAQAVVTDSGGLQKEAFLLGTPCLTLRNETEWTESIEAGGNRLAGTEPGAVVDALDRLLAAAPPRHELMASAARAYGDGQAGERIAQAIDDYFEGHAHG